MLSEKTIESIVNDAMKKYAASNDGERGLSKEDIEETVIRRGGNKQDVYRAMALSIKLCLGVDAEPIRYLMN